MASMFGDLSLVADVHPTFRPQLFTVTAAGLAVPVTPDGTTLMNAILDVGAVDTLTSLVVKLQASPDGSGSWVDILEEDGSTVVAFDTITTANNNGSTPQVIAFQIPRNLTVSSDPYIYVRAYATLVGTSVYFDCLIIACKRMPNPSAGYTNAPPIS